MEQRPLPPTRQVGKTSLRLPALGFGAAHLGGMYRRVPGEEARATLDAGWTGGVRYFDTAPFYGNGLSEHRTGSYLIDKDRRDFVLTTKVGRYLRRPADPDTFDRAPWGGGLNFECVFDYSYDGFMRSYEQSLQRLATDRIDALLVHDLDAGAHGDQFEKRLNDLTTSGFKALEELKRAGDIRAIGMGINIAASLDNIATLVDLDFIVLAMPYTLLDQGVLHDGLARCLRDNIGVVVGAPFASGILATGPGPDARYGYVVASDAIQDKVRRIQAVGDAHGVPLQAAALQFPVAHPAVVSVIPGASRPSEISNNIASMQAVIPDSFWRDLKSEGLIHIDAPVPQAARRIQPNAMA